MKRWMTIGVSACVGLCACDVPAGRAVEVPDLDDSASRLRVTETEIGLWPVCPADVDGDGEDEFIVRILDEGDDDLGVLEHGEPLTAEPLLVRADVGDTVRCAGDVNGDGFDDVLALGSLHLGGADGLSPAHGWEEPGDGHALDAWPAGDIDEDGHDDVWVMHTAEGRGPVLHRGEADGLSPWPFLDATEGSGHGTGQVLLADLDGDGRREALVEGFWRHRSDWVTWQAIELDTDGEILSRTDLARSHSDGCGLSQTLTLVAAGVGEDGSDRVIRRSLEGCSPRPRVEACSATDCTGLRGSVFASLDVDRDEVPELVYAELGTLWISPVGQSIPQALRSVTEEDVLSVAVGPSSGTGHASLAVWAVRDGEVVVTGLTVEAVDEDGDGYTLSDCDDADASIHPGADEIPDNGIDEDCDDWGAPCRVDADGDLFFGPDTIEGVRCRGAYGSLALPVSDCDDQTSSRHPAAEERPGGLDANCDGFVLCYEDLDRDGFGAGDPVRVEGSCDEPGLSELGTDCRADDPAFHPDAPDDCFDGVDTNCDRRDGRDWDRDGFCWSAGGGRDCDDSAWSVNPAATELWYDGVDQDCDGADDFDQDRDGSRFPEDCGDQDPSVGPHGEEVPDDGLDSDCDGFELCYANVDGDGFRTDELVPGSLSCRGDGYAPASTPAGDCNDLDPTVYPAARGESPLDRVNQNCFKDAGLGVRCSGCSGSPTSPLGPALLTGLLILLARRKRPHGPVDAPAE